MKTVLMGFFLLVISQVSLAAPTPTSYSYKVHTEDVGDIETTAADKPQAFKMAASECFARRSAVYKHLRGDLPEDVAIAIIDECANLPW